MENKLYNYINDPEKDITNFKLGLEYYKQEQYGAALSFFLRAAELTHNPLIAYNSLLLNSNGVRKQTKRNNLVKNQLQHAINTMPERPEAYYLLGRYYLETSQFYDSYTISEIGLKRSNLTPPPLLYDVEYPGEYGFIFNKAISAWNTSRHKEARTLLQDLVNRYYPLMESYFQNTTEQYITSLGSGPESQAFLYYHKSFYPKLRCKFAGAENIERSYSQVYQDMFILSMTGGKRGGTFLEIGGADPIKGNNTYLLEKEFGWEGISIEYKSEFGENYKKIRPTKVLIEDALTIDYNKLLSETFAYTDIDYLQLDIEPSRNTYELLLKIPFDKYRFGVITYEHDHYVDVTKTYRDKSRKYLREKGYQMVVNDISPDGISTFEDWWIHPDLIDPSILEIMTDLSSTIKKADQYILNQ
jgi:tetratricopeptide (TPR) repeat protein